MNQYEPLEYWKEKGKTYYQDFKYNEEYYNQEKVLMEYLSKLEFSTVLEFGCGFGRIIRLIDIRFQPKKYFAVDISEEQLSYFNFPRVTKIQSDIESYSIPEKFDLIIAVEVLMHQTPDKIQSIIDKMISLSKKHVINVDYYWEGEELAEHNFNHNYPQLYRYKADMTRIGKQALFHYETV